MERTETRPVAVKYCDFCGKESKYTSKCAVCKREMCTEGGGTAHAAYDLDLYRYSDDQRIYSAHVCKECSPRPPLLTIQALLDGMLEQAPILPVLPATVTK